MIYKTLGKTNLSVSRIGFGGIPVQRTTKEEVERLIARAEELGINFIDSAIAYTVSEEYFGNALKNRRKNFVIATKSPEKTKDGILKDVELSLKRLGTDYIDLYQFHNVRNAAANEQILGENGAYEGLLQAKKEGKILHIGATFHPLDTMKDFVKKCPEIETCMFPYNLVERQAEEYFNVLNEKNIGVIAMKPFAGGNIEKANLALKFILQNDNVTSAIPGMASVSEVEENAKIAENIAFSEEELQALELVRDELSGNFCRRCDYCKPCPQGIDIPVVQTYANYVRKYDLKNWATERYFGLAKRAKDCVNCKTCETRCPYELKIADKMRQIKELFKDE